MTTKTEQLGTLLDILIETAEDLSRGERSALLRWAHDVDKDLNAISTTNPNFDRAYVDIGYVRNVSRRAIEAGCEKKDCRVCDKTRRLLKVGGRVEIGEGTGW